VLRTWAGRRNVHIACMQVVRAFGVSCTYLCHAQGREADTGIKTYSSTSISIRSGWSVSSATTIRTSRTEEGRPSTEGRDLFE
jgi:hypothetical protein